MFQIKDNHIDPLPETLLIPEFRNIWNKSKDKEVAIKEFAYIYFVEDFKSPYKKGLTGKELEDKVVIDLFNSEWKPSDLVLLARNKYRELKTTSSMKLLEGAEKQIKDITNFLNTSDINELEADKRPAAIKTIMSVIKEIDEVTLKLQSTKQRIEKELEAAKMSGKRLLNKRELPPSKRK